MKHERTVEAITRVEHELLLCLTRPYRTALTSQRISLALGEQVDWEYLIETANDHRVLPLLAREIQPFATSLPHHVMTQLRQEARQIADSNLGLSGKLLKLLALLHENDVPAVPYKGPALAQTAYGDIKLRQFTDLDILVPKHDLHKIKALLLANGCEPGWRLTKQQEAGVLRHYYEYPFLCNDRRILVEVHWALAEHFFSFSFDIDQLRSRLETTTILGNSIQTLGPEDSLLVICAHGSKHAWKRLGWICDVAHLVWLRSDLDWPVIFERAAALGLTRMLSLGLLLAKELLEVDLPERCSQRLKLEPAVVRLAGDIIESLFRSTSGYPGTLDHPTLLQLRMRERMRDRLKFCFRLIISTKLVDSLFMPMGRPR
jgi:hypothetical protein